MKAVCLKLATLDSGESDDYMVLSRSTWLDRLDQDRVKRVAAEVEGGKFHTISSICLELAPWDTPERAQASETYPDQTGKTSFQAYDAL